MVPLLVFYATGMVCYVLVGSKQLLKATYCIKQDTIRLKKTYQYSAWYDVM